jgi:hypothetical protein
VEIKGSSSYGALVPACALADGGDPVLSSVLEWMSRDLTVPQEGMGRSNAVCPFLARGISTGSVWMRSVYGVGQPDRMAEVILDHLALIDSLPPIEDEQLKSIVLVFPEIAGAEDARRLVDEVQYAVKPAVVDAGFMVGELHPWNDTPPRAAPGSTYRPNRSPMAAMALRRLHPHDAGFLLGDSDPVRARRLLLAYLRQIDWRRIPARVQAEILGQLDSWLAPAGVAAR